MNKDLPSRQQIWNLAYPMILSLLAQNIINVTNTAFLGRVGEVELGASAIGGLFYIALFMLGFGFATGSQIMIARRNGEKNYRDIGNIFDHSLYFLFILAILLFLLIRYLTSHLLGHIIESDAVYQASKQFLNYRIYGIFFAFVNVLFRAYYVGITHTKYLSWAAGIMALLNVLLDYLLIFGNFGFPKMGISGAALSSVISEGVSALFFILIGLKRYNLAKYRIFTFPSLKISVLRRLLELSVYIMMQFFVSMTAWFVFFMIIEKRGEHALAISNIIRSAYMVLMLPIWAFSSAANSLVSNNIGAGKINLVMPILWKVARMSLSLVSMIVVFSLIFPRFIIGIYTSDTNLIEGCVPVLYVVSVSLLLFSVVQIYFSGISGTAKTNMAMIIEFSTILLYLFYVYFTAIYLKLGIEMVWTSEFVYFLLLGLMSYSYLRWGRWQGKVI